jgi:site-specific recombinase XerD
MKSNGFTPATHVDLRDEAGRQEQSSALTLQRWTELAERAYSANTLRAWRADWSEFTAFCTRQKLDPLPADPATVRSFIHDRLKRGKKPATIRRAIATIARAHRSANAPDPTASEEVRLALKEMGRTTPARQRQARALTWEEIARYLTVEPEILRDHRDRALVALAYDTMCRREELVSLKIEDLHREDDGSGTILIRRSKTDTTGEGAVAYLSPLTMRLIQTWLTEADLKKGPIFYALGAKHSLKEPLRAAAVSETFKRIGRWLRLPSDQVAALSGHSTRVGAAQDLIALNIDLASVMQSGRWKDTRMPMRYAEKVLAKRGGMARAAKAQGKV